MKIAMAQINPILGNLEYNYQRIIKYYEDAEADECDLVVFPECVLTGYPLEDLVLNSKFLADVDTYVKKIINFVAKRNTAIIFGTPRKVGDDVFNSAYVIEPCHTGFYYQYIIDKSELPNFGVFDEKRVFKQGTNKTTVRIRGHEFGVMICEDGWHPRVNVALAEAGAEFLICINGSPFESKKQKIRIEHMAARSKEAGNIPVMYVNLVGGQDELVFDGGSFVIADGNLNTQAPHFQECLGFVEYDLEEKKPKFGGVGFDQHEFAPPLEDVYRALVLGLRDYVSKNGFKDVVLGMSGGVDSALVAAIAADALGPDKVHLVRMPSAYSSKGSLVDAHIAATMMGIKSLETVFIDGTYQALKGSVSTTLTGLADENLQARIRGMILMSLSNQNGWMVLSTGNKSEVSVGYSTLYGDMCGGYNPIKDIYKTMVWDLCRWRNQQTEVNRFSFLGNNKTVIPNSIIDKAPSAELRPGQLDEQSLPPYPVLDRILTGLVEENKSVEELVKTGEKKAIVEKISTLLRIAEYKRRQACPGVKITSKIFGRDRRYPITNAWRG